MIKLGLVAPDAEHFDFYEAWGKLIRAGWSNESLKKITPAALARLKEEIAGNVVEFPKQRMPKVES